MSTYSSDEELGQPIIEAAIGGLHFVDVASSPIENDVRLILGDDTFFMTPAVADQLAAALTRQARRAERFDQVVQ